MTRLAQIAVPDEMLQRARAGEEHGCAQLYEALAGPTFTLIRRLIAQKALAEDIFQDTMMAFYQRLGSFRGEAPVGAWLRQIAISRCLMALRSPWHRARLHLDTLGAETLPLVTDAPRAETIDVERALAGLSPTARAVVWLYEVEGYSHQEIARHFGRSVSFSKSQLARAHERLRAWFEPKEDAEPCTQI